MFLRYYIESILDRLLDFNIFLINSKFWNICGKKVLIHIDYLITLPRFCWILHNCWCHKLQICIKSFFSFKIVKYMLGRSPSNGMAIHSSILAWRISRTEEPGRLESMVSQRVRHNRVTNTFKAYVVLLKAMAGIQIDFDLLWLWYFCWCSWIQLKISLQKTLMTLASK